MVTVHRHPIFGVSTDLHERACPNSGAMANRHAGSLRLTVQRWSTCEWLQYMIKTLKRKDGVSPTEIVGHGRMAGHVADKPDPFLLNGFVDPEFC